MSRIIANDIYIYLLHVIFPGVHFFYLFRGCYRGYRMADATIQGVVASNQPSQKQQILNHAKITFVCLFVFLSICLSFHTSLTSLYLDRYIYNYIENYGELERCLQDFIFIRINITYKL